MKDLKALNDLEYITRKYNDFMSAMRNISGLFDTMKRIELYIYI